MDWNRHDNNIYVKVTQWFKVMEPELRGVDIKPENVHNIDETGVMLSMLGSVTVLLGKHDYRGAGVKRTVTAVECISASGECLKPMIIWLASTHRSNWTRYDTPGWVTYMLSLNLAIPTLTLPCNGYYKYLIPRQRHGRTANHRYSDVTASGPMRLSRS
jgi:hypothetical protein